MEGETRIDKWLWAVRLYKTRSLATDACRSGRVALAGQPVKPSHVVKAGETFSVSFPPMTRTVRVIVPITARVAAKLVPGFMEDLTPQEEFGKLKRMRETGFEFRDRGAGRPTKRERRDIEYLKKYLGE